MESKSQEEIPDGVRQRDASRLPCMVIDTREQSPLAFTRLQAVPGTLQAGDYSIAGCESEFAVERKSWAACWWVNVQRMAGLEARQPAWAREGIRL